MASAALRAQVENLTEDISRQKQLLDEMETHLKDLRAQLDSIPYPVLTLPIEITSMIFVHCLSPSRNTSDIRLENNNRPALLLMRVCRAWKEIALGTVELWTRFGAVLANRSHSRSESFAQLLKRSRSCTLDVELSTSRSQLLDDERFDDDVKMLRQYCRRIRCLDLDMSLETVQKLDGCALDFPALERLVISDEEYIDSEDGFQLNDYPGRVEMFKHSSRLRSVELDFCTNPTVIPLFAFDLPWQQLTHFEGGQFDLADCLVGLDRMPNLTNCYLDVFDTVDSDDVPHSHHPNVQHLRINEYEKPRVFEHLTVPHLQTLAFDYVSHFDPRTLSTFLKRSSPPLQKLSIACDEGGVTLELSPSLTELPLTELEISRPTEELVNDFFLAYSMDTTFLPQLRDLSFLDCYEVKPEDNEADVLLIAKRAGRAITRAQAFRAPLRSLRISSAPKQYHESHEHRITTFKFPEDDIGVFRASKQNGMKIHIGTDRESFI